MKVETNGFSLPQPVRAESLSHQTFLILKDAIFSGKFVPGEHLREMHLAKMLQVSQATIREALVQMERVGLVIREQNRRTTVTSFTPAEVRDRLKMRIALEQMAAIEAAERADEDTFILLDAMAAEIESSIKAGDYYANVRADVRFHQYIWEKSDSTILATTLDQLTTPLWAFIGVLNQAGLVDLKSTKSHQSIVEAIKSKDEERIRAEIRSHVEGSYQKFFDSGLDRLDGLLPR